MTLAIVDIRTGDVPSKWFSVLVTHQVVGRQEPPVTSVGFAYPMLGLEVRTARQSAIPLSLDPLFIIRMDFRGTFAGYTPIDPFIKRDAEIVERNAIHENPLPIGTEDDNALWRQVEDLPEFFLALAQGLYGLHALFDVEVNPDPIKQSSIAAAKRLRAANEPAVFTACIAYAVSYLARGSRS